MMTLQMNQSFFARERFHIATYTPVKRSILARDCYHEVDRGPLSTSYTDTHVTGLHHHCFVMQSLNFPSAGSSLTYTASLLCLDTFVCFV